MLGMEPGSIGIVAGAPGNVSSRMSSKRTSRKRRKQRRASAAPPRAPAVEAQAAYARSRAKDEEARASLKPLRAGERPTAVTVGALVAAALPVANLVALAFGYNASENAVSPGSEVTGSILTTLILVVVAYGMWKARYWGVLGMQTLLALTLITASLALLFANSVWAALLLVLIIAGAGTLFWFLIKAMARIQMPERPGSSR
jgi:cation transport ATPase